MHNIMRRSIIYFICILALWSQRARAQEPMPLSLEEATNYALKHNAAIKNARLDVAIQKAKNAEVTGLALPQVNAKDEFTSYPNQLQSFVPAEIIGGPAGTYVAVPFTPKFSNTASATASQIVFDGTVLVALQAKKTLVKLSELGAQSTAQDVRYTVHRSYYALIVSRKSFEIVSSSLQVIRKMANEQAILRKEGFVEKIDIDRTNVQLTNLETDSISIGNMLTVGEQSLKYAMGMDINTPIVLTDNNLDAQISAAAGDLLAEADYDKRVEYNLLRTQLRLNEYDLKRYRYKGLPSLNAFATGAYTYSANKFTEVASPSNYLFYSVVGATLNVPIFSGFQRANQVKQARYNVEKTLNSIDNIKLAIDFQTQQSRSNLRNAILKMQNQERNLELAKSVVDIANKKYKAGVGSSLEVNDAQSSLLQTQNNYFQSMLDVINAQADLQKALGEFAN